MEYFIQFFLISELNCSKISGRQYFEFSNELKRLVYCDFKLISHDYTEKNELPLKIYLFSKQIDWLEIAGRNTNREKHPRGRNRSKNTTVVSRAEFLT